MLSRQQNQPQGQQQQAPPQHLQTYGQNFSMNQPQIYHHHQYDQQGPPPQQQFPAHGGGTYIPQANQPPNTSMPNQNQTNEHRPLQRAVCALSPTLAILLGLLSIAFPAFNAPQPDNPAHPPMTEMTEEQIAYAEEQIERQKPQMMIHQAYLLHQQALHLEQRSDQLKRGAAALRRQSQAGPQDQFRGNEGQGQGQNIPNVALNAGGPPSQDYRVHPPATNMYNPNPSSTMGSQATPQVPLGRASQMAPYQPPRQEVPETRTSNKRARLATGSPEPSPSAPPPAPKLSVKPGRKGGPSTTSGGTVAKSRVPPASHTHAGPSQTGSHSSSSHSIGSKQYAEIFFHAGYGILDKIDDILQDNSTHERPSRDNIMATAEEASKLKRTDNPDYLERTLNIKCEWNMIHTDLVNALTENSRRPMLLMMLTARLHERDGVPDVIKSLIPSIVLANPRAMAATLYLVQSLCHSRGNGLDNMQSLDSTRRAIVHCVVYSMREFAGNAASEALQPDFDNYVLAAYRYGLGAFAPEVIRSISLDLWGAVGGPKPLVQHVISAFVECLAHQMGYRMDGEDESCYPSYEAHPAAPTPSLRQIDVFLNRFSSFAKNPEGSADRVQIKSLEGIADPMRATESHILRIGEGNQMFGVDFGSDLLRIYAIEVVFGFNALIPGFSEALYNSQAKTAAGEKGDIVIFILVESLTKLTATLLTMQNEGEIPVTAEQIINDAKAQEAARTKRRTAIAAANKLLKERRRDYSAIRTLFLRGLGTRIGYHPTHVHPLHTVAQATPSGMLAVAEHYQRLKSKKPIPQGSTQRPRPSEGATIETFTVVPPFTPVPLTLPPASIARTVTFAVPAGNDEGRKSLDELHQISPAFHPTTADRPTMAAASSQRRRHDPVVLSRYILSWHAKRCSTRLPLGPSEQHAWLGPGSVVHTVTKDTGCKAYGVGEANPLSRTGAAAHPAANDWKWERRSPGLGWNAPELNGPAFDQTIQQGAPAAFFQAAILLHDAPDTLKLADSTSAESVAYGSSTDSRLLACMGPLHLSRHEWTWSVYATDAGTGQHPPLLLQTSILPLPLEQTAPEGAIKCFHKQRNFMGNCVVGHSRRAACGSLDVALSGRDQWDSSSLTPIVQCKNCGTWVCPIPSIAEVESMRPTLQRMAQDQVNFKGVGRNAGVGVQPGKQPFMANGNAGLSGRDGRPLQPPFGGAAGGVPGQVPGPQANKWEDHLYPLTWTAAGQGIAPAFGAPAAGFSTSSQDQGRSGRRYAIVCAVIPVSAGAERAEYNSLLETVATKCNEFETTKLAMMYSMNRNEEYARRIITLVATVQRQRTMVSSGSPLIIISLDSLRQAEQVLIRVNTAFGLMLQGRQDQPGKPPQPSMSGHPQPLPMQMTIQQRMAQQQNMSAM
ncbi:hypothetical protein NMY22_g17182 [Coprinellus aureogranulatus]|nr:hypothetical protein NMY22_g17182 [Coprinellus aureogranulatus]